MTPDVRYPSNPITPHGAYHVLHDRIPMIGLNAHDGSVAFHLMGGMAIPDRMTPERVELKGLKGLIAPSQTIDLKGATQDGVTFVDSLLDPAEVELEAIVHGRNPKYARKVYNHLISSIDEKKTSELWFFTQELGRWWANVRWFKGAPPNPMNPAHKRQGVSLRLRSDTGCWQSYPNIDSFEFAYEDMTDTFTLDRTVERDLGPNWPQDYNGDGGGFSYSNGNQAVWLDDPEDTWTTLSREVVNGPYKDFATATDNQVINIVLGSFQELALFWDQAHNDIWGRMGRNLDGTWNGYGIRLRLGAGYIQLTRYNNYVPTVMREWGLLDWQTWIPPLPGEKFTLVCGYEGSPRMFKVFRNGTEIISFQETGTGSALGSDYRGIGFGQRAGAALLTQATPANVRKISAGDNAVITQSGFVERINKGDQDFWDRYTCYGPGLFSVGNGPGSTEMVEFGPLLPNQVMQIRTDPRKYGVVDMTWLPPTTQELDFFQQALSDIISFATGNNAPPLLEALKSSFGILPPQGNPYSLLQGRFSNPVPAKSPGRPAQTYHVKVEIAGGNADSKIIAAGTPLRRNPY
jgi:hypothetical protein